jgi:hypothetical protein
MGALAFQFIELLRAKLKAEVGRDRLGAILGENLRRSKAFVSGLTTFRYLLREGLKEHDVLVDYGCGTLRVGVHAIKYLAPGAYWGLEIDEAILANGCKLVGPKLMAKKVPNLRVISQASLEEVASMKPALICSFKVMTRVPPAELGTYISNIIALIGASGKAIIQSKWSDDQTFQFSGQHWAHSLLTIRELIALNGGRLAIIGQRDWQSRQLAGKAVMLRIEA